MALLLPDGRDLRRSGRVIVSDTQRNRLQIYHKVKNYTTAAHHLARPPDPVYAPFAAPQVTNYPPILDAARANSCCSTLGCLVHTCVDVLSCPHSRCDSRAIPRSLWFYPMRLSLCK